MRPRHPPIRHAAAMAAAVIALGVAAAFPASATSPRGGGVEQRGDCTQSSQWRLKADPDNGRIRVEAEVDTGADGQRWSWRLLHNGGVSAHGNSVTQDGGSYKIQRLLIDAPGTDRIVFKSHNAASGEQCSGSVRF